MELFPNLQLRLELEGVYGLSSPLTSHLNWILLDSPNTSKFEKVYGISLENGV